jgi:Iap family predicted aminopeptidase
MSIAHVRMVGRFRRGMLAFILIKDDCKRFIFAGNFIFAAFSSPLPFMPIFSSQNFKIFSNVKNSIFLKPQTKIN